jgi:hypothetical protein
VSCPDWTALTAHRNDRHGAEPEGWNEVLAHFDGGCQLCRKAALKADPTLVFRRLAQVPAATMTDTQERAEVDSVRQAVAAMRAASRLEKGRRRGFGFLPAAAGGWKRWSAAAALATMALTVPSHDTRLHKSPAEVEALEVPAQIGAAPVLEGGVDLPGARVYQLGDEELAVVMVFDESFDESFGG